MGEINDLKSKTMSKILFGLVGIALISSCTRPGSLYNGGQRIANCVTSEPFEVPVQEGCATYVMYGQDCRYCHSADDHTNPERDESIDEGKYR